jgi:predicted nuclease of predicted toxin-antitoxin system
MKLWIDEDLSPALVDVAHRRGLDAACNRDRGLLGGSDVEVLRRCIDEDRTLVTNNFGDFRRLCETRLVHPGLVVLPSVTRDVQKRLLDIALDHIERQTTRQGATDPGEFMINRVVEVDEDGVCTDFQLPSGVGGLD